MIINNEILKDKVKLYFSTNTHKINSGTWSIKELKEEDLDS